MARLTALVLSAALGAAAPSFAAETGGKIYVLKSSGVCDGCAEAISKMLFRGGISSQILGPEELRSAVGPRDTVIVGGGIPGGEGEWPIKQALVRAGAFLWLKDHIANGGTYIGICAGAYLAEKWIDRDGDEPGLDVFPGEIENYSKDKSAKIVRTRWDGAGGTRGVYFQDGPAFIPRKGAAVITAATFTKDRRPAAVIFPFGKGTVGLVSPHPEADDDWVKEARLKDADGVDYDLGIAFVRQVLGKAARP